jgi:hypothetical protein
MLIKEVIYPFHSLTPKNGGPQPRNTQARARTRVCADGDVRPREEWKAGAAAQR